jgi:hypothetical protein
VSDNVTYPLAAQGVFRTVQGEGVLLGVPMVFVRLAGCSVKCGGCDTDYAAHSEWTLGRIAEAVAAARGNAEWVWVTGGEPADHELWPLLEVARLHVHVWAGGEYCGHPRVGSCDSTNWLLDSFAYRKALPFLTLAECVELVVKRYQRRERVPVDASVTPGLFDGIPTEGGDQ